MVIFYLPMALALMSTSPYISLFCRYFLQYLCFSCLRNIMDGKCSDGRRPSGKCQGWEMSGVGKVRDGKYLGWKHPGKIGQGGYCSIITIFVSS